MTRQLVSVAVALGIPFLATASLLGTSAIADELVPQSAKLNQLDVHAKTGNSRPAFDIVHAKIVTQKHWLTFHMHVSGRAGSAKPTKSGKLAGSRTFAYV